MRPAAMMSKRSNVTITTHRHLHRLLDSRNSSSSCAIILQKQCPIFWHSDESQRQQRQQRRQQQKEPLHCPIRLYHDALPRIHRWSSWTASCCSSSSSILGGSNLGKSILDYEKNNHHHLVIPTLSKQYRGFATTTTTTSTSSTTTSTADVQSPQEEDNDPHHDKTMTTTTWRERYRERARNLRENATASLTEFREHPGQSVKSGAKTFSGMMRAYGPIFFYIHVSLYTAVLAGLFVGVDSGILDPVYLMSLIGNSAAQGATETKNTVDFVVEWMQNHSYTQGMAPFVERNPHFASLAVAWIVVKFTEPIRLPISLFLTPRVSRYLGIQPKQDNDDNNKGATDDATTTTTTDTTYQEKDGSSTTTYTTAAPTKEKGSQQK